MGQGHAQGPGNTLLALMMTAGRWLMTGHFRATGPIGGTLDDNKVPLKTKDPQTDLDAGSAKRWLLIVGRGHTPSANLSGPKAQREQALGS